jgi:N6-adenosine-specific RNA methylase IME4
VENSKKDLFKDPFGYQTARMNEARPAPLRPQSDLTPLPSVVGGFSTVLADPPWRFTNRTGKVAPEHRRLDRYSTMSLDEIKSVPVSDVVSKHAHLYLWVPNALLPDGLSVMGSWGFRYVSNIIWAKRRKDGGPDGRGVGFYFRNVTEILLFGVRGSMRTLSHARSQVNMIETRKREHSRKPDEQYSLITACSPGPYLEVFARHPREGWFAWGDEASEEIVPRGRVHKGYSGGTNLPPLQSNVHVSEKLAHSLSHELRKRYEAGSSIRDLSESSGYSIQRVRSFLSLAETPMRSRGRRAR